MLTQTKSVMISVKDDTAVKLAHVQACKLVQIAATWCVKKLAVMASMMPTYPATEQNAL